MRRGRLCFNLNLNLHGGMQIQSIQVMDRWTSTTSLLSSAARGIGEHAS